MYNIITSQSGPTSRHNSSENKNLPREGGDGGGGGGK